MMGKDLDVQNLVRVTTFLPRENPNDFMSVLNCLVGINDRATGLPVDHQLNLDRPGCPFKKKVFCFFLTG